MRMVACDLDGTIVRPDGTISDRTLAALADCQRNGVHVVFVTGRPPRWMAPIVEMTGHRGLALCGNGAVVVDLATNEVIRSHTLDAATVREVAARLRRSLPGAAFALETLDGYRREPAYQPAYRLPPQAQDGELEDLLADSPTVIKVLCRQSRVTDGLDSDGMLAIARRELGDLVEVVHSDPASAMLEIAAAGVTKATALAWLAETLGVERGDVVAFGDMPNDVPMLAWAGAGYAMTGGHPEAVAACAAQAPPCEADGVAQVLEGYLARQS